MVAFAPNSAPPKIQCLRACNPIVSNKITSAPTKLRHSTQSHSDEQVRFPPLLSPLLSIGPALCLILSFSNHPPYLSRLRYQVLSELVNSTDQENFGFDVFSRPSVQPNSLRALLNHETFLRKRSEGTNMNSIRVRMPCLPDIRGSSITSLSVLSSTNKGIVSKD